MQDSQVNNDATCLLCCQEREFFVLPKCNHKHICWRCCINMIKEGNLGCPFCKSSVNEKQKIIFVTLQHMKQYSYSEILKTRDIELLKSEKNSNYFYSNQQVAEKIEYQTSYNCPFDDCQELFDSLNQLKKHLDLKHKRQYCDICLTNRKCIHSQQILYSENQYQRHIKMGQFSENGDLILYHPTCTFCRQLFYDIDQFKRHLERQHQKCFICHKNSEQLKYVYFENYEQAVVHFKKSHFYCEISTCMATKFENVFVTQQALNQHVLRAHKKAKKNDQPIMNIVLGFNKAEEQAGFDWDNIGKNFKSIFQMVQKNSSILNLKPVDHHDFKIDIRDFYPQQSKKVMNLSLNRIREKIQDKRYDMKYKQSDLYIDDVDFFKPLEMPSLMRVELQKFLTTIFDKKITDPIISKFFSGRQDFSSPDQYFGFVKEKMKSYSKVAFYYAFPQLVRFFKNQNPHKPLMDQYYYQTLRQLKVKRSFVIHTKQKYSQILFFMKQLIEKEIEQRDQDYQNSNKQLEVQKYISFLKDTSLTYYVKHQQDIFFVSKEKITNLYHMINKCRVQDFLKMNWLLKIGFSNEAYKIISKQFYYKQEKDCYHAMKKLNIQQLAYLYAYCTICLESIFDKNAFKKSKDKPSPLFLSQILGRIKRSSTYQRMPQVLQCQRKFLSTDHHINYNKDKGVIINTEEHPSLLDRNIQVESFKPKPPDRRSQDFPTMAAFGTIRPKLWNQQTDSIVKNSTISKKKVEDYPSILSNPTKKQPQKPQQEQFPVFHYVGKKNKIQKTQNKTMTLNEAIGWGGSSYLSNKWSEQTALKNWQKRQEDQKRRIKRHEQAKKQMKVPAKTEQKSVAQQKLQPEIVKNQDKKNKRRKQQKISTIEAPKPIQQKSIQQVPMVFIMSKKNQKIDEQETLQPTKKKNKNKNKNQPSQKLKQQKNASNKNVEKFEDECGLFQRIEKESQLISKKQKQQEEKSTSLEVPKKQENKPTSQSYAMQKSNYENFSKGDFPALHIGEVVQKQSQNSLQNNWNKKEIKNKAEQKPQQKQQKKRKMRVDDTSSDQDKTIKKQQHKKSEDFVSLSDKFGKGEEKLSKVNQIIQNANVEQKPQNVIHVKKNKRGKKEIIERVNLQNLW